MQVVGSSPTTIQAKVWKAGNPRARDLAAQRHRHDRRAAGLGYVGISPFCSGATTNSPIAVQLDELTVTAP